MKKMSPPNFGGVGKKIKLTRKSRKPRTSFYREPGKIAELSLSEEDWTEIEKLYGNPLPRDLRNEIIETVNDYFHFVRVERSRYDAADAIAFLVELEELATSLADMLVNDLQNPAATGARDALRTSYFFDQDDPDFNLCPYESKMEAVEQALRALASSTMELTGDLSSDATCKSSEKKPDAWEVMIVRLTKAFNGRRLPASAVKGSASAFVVLVQELQERFPAEFRRHQYGRDGEISIDATEKAIFDAQDAYRSHQNRH